MISWQRSWALAGMSFRVIKQDKEMLLFPVCAGFFSMLFSALILVPTTILPMLNRGFDPNAMSLVALVSTYVAVAFCAAFFNVCAVYTTKVRLSGGDATFFDSIGFALSRIHLIFAWSLVSASVGLLFNAIERVANKAGLAGKIVLLILRLMLVVAWDVMTVFVVPVMVYEGVGPFAAMRRSVETLRKVWGEGASVFFATGLVTFVLVFPAFFALFAVPLVVASAGLPPVMAVVLFGLLGVYILGASLVMGVVRTVYVTALFSYATTGVVPAGFTEEAMVGAFTGKQVPAAAY